MRKITLLATTALMAAMASLTMAAAPAGAAVATEVGGGAAAIQVNTFTFTPGGERETVFDPIVVLLPRQGSTPISSHLLGATIGAIDVGVVRARTEGNLNGTPFARSSAGVVGINIPGVDVGAVSTDCTWDLAGARAHTSLVRANGTYVGEAPSGFHTLPNDAGYYVTNEQTVHNFDGRDVIDVIGLRVFLNGSNGVDREYIFAESSCDPLKLPSLTGTYFFGD